MIRKAFACGGLLLVAVLLLLPVAAMAQDAADAIAVGLTTLLGPYAGPAALVGGIVVGVAKLICAFTDTPAPDSPWAKVYKGIEVLALIVGKMKHAVILTLVPIGMLALSACSTAPASPVQQLTTACNAYASSLYTLAGYRAAGKLTPADVAAVDDARSLVNPICAGQPPEDGTAALATVRAALDRYSAIQAGVRQ